MNRKRVVILIIAITICLAGFLIFASKGSGDGDKKDVVLQSTDGLQDSVSDNSATDSVDEDKHELAAVDELPTDTVDSKNFVYDPFAEDAGWGNKSIFGTGIVIEGTGSRDEIAPEPIITVEENMAEKNTRDLTAAEAQAALMEKVKSKDYNYRINVNDFSEGFGVYGNPKYDLGVGRIMGDTGYIYGPNDTEVGIKECDPSKSVEDYRLETLMNFAFSYMGSMSDGPSMPYDTKCELGKGIVDFEKTDLYSMWCGKDLSINDYGDQLFCDCEMRSSFGNGCYIEILRSGSTKYRGCYIVEHNGRIFIASGESTYRDTLLDIILASIDTGVYVY